MIDVILFLIFVSIAVLIIYIRSGFGKVEIITKISTFLPASLTSKLPSLTTTFCILVVAIIAIIAIVSVSQFLFSFGSFAISRTPEGFDDEELKYTPIRDCNGQYHIVNGSMLIAGPVSMVNTNVPWDNQTYWFDYLVERGESAKVVVTFRNETTMRSFLFFISGSVGYRSKLEFGIGRDGFPFVDGFYSGFKDSRAYPFRLQKDEPVDITVKFHAPTGAGVCQLELYEINIG